MESSNGEVGGPAGAPEFAPRIGVVGEAIRVGEVRAKQSLGTFLRLNLQIVPFILAILLCS